MAEVPAGEAYPIHLSKPDHETIWFDKKALVEKIWNSLDQGHAVVAVNPATQEVSLLEGGDKYTMPIAFVIPHNKEIGKRSRTQIPLTYKRGGITCRLSRMPVYVISAEGNKGEKKVYIVGGQKTKDEMVTWELVIKGARNIVAMAKFMAAAEDPLGELRKDLQRSVEKEEMTRREMDEILQKEAEEPGAKGPVLCPIPDEPRELPKLITIEGLNRLDEEEQKRYKAALTTLLPSIIEDAVEQ